MKRAYFIKHDQRIRRFTGCDRATLIFDRLEFYSSKQPDGFYKFLEPNSHRLYKKGDSWTELLDCHRTSFWRAFKLIGKKHTSRWTFEKSEDKFEGKLYASYYDRNTNRMFFIRNNEAVKEFFTKIQPKSELVDKSKKTKDNSQSGPKTDQTKDSLRTEQNARSHKESNSSSLDLSKDKSHAEEIIKKMIEIWTAIVQEGRGQVELEGNTIPFLKKAFKDKFNSCLQKWKNYCMSIASSKFLMGEKTPWKADLEWALKFESIRKVLSGNYYGIGDRTPKAILPSQTNLQEEIVVSSETQEVKDFRSLCLKTVGNAKYISYFKDLTIKFREDGDIALISPNKFSADQLERNCYSYLRLILQGLGENSKEIVILAPGETVGRLVLRERVGRNVQDLLPDSMVEDSLPEESFVEETTPEDETLPENSSKTQSLREQLKNIIPSNMFPSWLSDIEVKDISQDGTVVVTFDDQLTVDYARKRFFQQILQATTKLCGGITDLVIQSKPDNLLAPEKSGGIGIEERNLVKQAIQSLIGAGLGRGATLLNDKMPY